MSLTDTLLSIRSLYNVKKDSGDDYLSNNWFIIAVREESFYCLALETNSPIVSFG